MNVRMRFRRESCTACSTTRRSPSIVSEYRSVVQRFLRNVRRAGSTASPGPVKVRLDCRTSNGETMRYQPAVLLAFLLTAGSPTGVLPIAQPNDNRTPAGTVSDSGLTLSLEARRVMWYPEGDSLRGRFTEAFGESGKEPTVPGPLARVRAGTVVRLRVSNTDLQDTLRIVLAPALMRGIDTLKVAPGGTGEMRFTASQPGNHFYRALTKDVQSQGFLMKGLLGGAIVVDSASGMPRADRVL